MHIELGGVDPLIMNTMVAAICSYHFSDFGVGNHVSSGHVDSFPKASHFAGCNFAHQRLGHGPGLALVCQFWYEDGVHDFALCVKWNSGMFYQQCKLVADIVGFLYPVFDFPVHSTIFCEYAAKIFELFDLFEICDFAGGA